MKSIFYLLLFAFAISCSQKNNQQTIVKGTIANESVDTVTLSFDNKKLSVPVESGTFHIELSVDKPMYCTLHSNKDFPLFISPASELSINVLADTIVFSGQNRDANIFLQTRNDKVHSILSGFNDNEIFILPEMQFVQAIDSFANKQELLLVKKILPKEFVEREKARIYYWKLDMLCTYHRYSPTFTQNVMLPSNNYFDFIKTVDVDNAYLFELDEYKEFVFSYVLGKTFIKSIEDSLNEEDRNKLMFSMAEELFSNAAIKEFVVLKAMKRLLYKFQLNETIVNRYKQAYAQSHEFQRIVEDFEKTKYLQKGNVAPDFKAVDIDGNEVRLSDFIGKAVFIDVWSPFCAPCIHEFSYCHALQKEYAGKEIVFVSICLDDNESRWKKNCENYHLQGVVLRAPNGRRSEIVTQYVIQGVPRFICVDKEGDIVSASAPYPSDSSLKALLDEIVH